MNKLKTVTLVVGFDQREAVAYHNFCQSVLEKASVPVQFVPLAKNSLYFYKETPRFHGIKSFWFKIAALVLMLPLAT